MIISNKHNSPLLGAVYYLFFSFIAASIVGVEGYSAFYAALIPFCTIAIFLALIQITTHSRINFTLLLLLIVTAPFLLFGPIEKHTIYIRLFATVFLLLFFLFTKFELTLPDFSRCLNLTYGIYLTLSVLDWVGALPFVPHESKNSFYITLFGYTVETLYGIGGSTADIDSYSGLILIWNLFVAKAQRSRLLMIVVSAAAMLLTFRMTPIVAILAACLSYLIVRNRPLALLVLIVPALGFIAVLAILIHYPYIQVPYIFNTDWYSLLWEVTHARSSIWLRQMQYYLFDFQLSDYILGPLDERMTVDFIDGEGRFHKESYNPHNTYLALLFRSTLIFFVFYSLFLYGAFKRIRKNGVPVVFFISTAAYTNSTIIGVQNPAFLLVLMYLLLAIPKDRFLEPYDRQTPQPDYPRSVRRPQT